MPRHGTRRSGAALAALAALALAAPPPASAERPAPLGYDTPLPPPAGHDVRVELEFGGDADLDLFVTGPMHEELYFGNSPSRIGGVFEGDRRCDDPAPRVETARYAPARAGRYRVSVDYMIRCRTDVDEVPYRVRVEANGERREIEGIARFGELELIVLEFEARPRAEAGPRAAAGTGARREQP